MATKTNSSEVKFEQFRKCMQEQCGFFHNEGCRSCKECKTESLKVNTHCAKCLACENVPGAIRWDDPETDEILERLQQLQVQIDEARKQENQIVLQNEK